MRKSLNDLRLIENYLFQRLPAAEQQAFKVRLLTESRLSEQVAVQQEVYALIKRYGRRQLKKELEAVHERMFKSPEKTWFRQKIKNLFTRKK